MDNHQGSSREQNILFIVAGLTALILAFPQPVYAVEVGCFCTFVFVSTMCAIGIGTTLIVKFILSKKMGKLSFKWTSLITGIEVILMFVILIVVQTQFYIRVLVYLPLSFLLNYSMMAAGDRALKEKPATKRATFAALNCSVLPLVVQIVVVLFTFLLNKISFKELSV